MTIPIEFTVLGNPSSVNSTSNKKNIWKALVENVARGAVAIKYSWDNSLRGSGNRKGVLFSNKSAIYRC